MEPTFIQRIKEMVKDLLIRFRTPPLIHMTWRNLYFASWPVPSDAVRPKVHPLQLDTFQGKAWVTMVAMQATDVHPVGFPPIPVMDSFRELNLRTYVTVHGKPGVSFLSIECAAAVVDWMSSHFFGIPYLRARVLGIEEDHCTHFATERTQADKPPAAFWGSFRALGGSSTPVPGSLEYFLLERYSAFFVRDGTIYRVDIKHPEWSLEQAAADIDINSIPTAAGLPISGKPYHTAFVSRTDTEVSPPTPEQ